jgi:hypothetical protein
MKILSGICWNGERDFIWLILIIFKGNTNVNKGETQVPVTAIEVIEEVSDLEVAVASMTEETAAIVTEEIVEIAISTDLDLAVHLQDSMTDHIEGKYLIKINKVLLDLEVHQHTTLGPEGADLDPEDTEIARNAKSAQDSVVVTLENSTEAAQETSATPEETWETKSTMVQDPTDPKVLLQEWGRTVTSVAPETSHQENQEENQETCLQEVTVQVAIATVVASETMALLEDSTIADPQEAADSNQEVVSETTADQEATSEAALAAVTETKRNKESWKRVSASFASSKATWPEIALRVANNVREAAAETEEGTSQEAMDTMTESHLTGYYK